MIADDSQTAFDPHKTPPLRIVLVGGGHSHVGVLRDFGMSPVRGVQLTLISREARSPYSGMLPGYVAGQWDYDSAHIDLARLAAFAGAQLIIAVAVGIDRNVRELRLDNGESLGYDLLAINIGATPKPVGDSADAAFGIAVKPIGDFNLRWLALLERARQHAGTLRIAVIGGGAGGVELALAMHRRLNDERRASGWGAGGFEMCLLTASDDILPSHDRCVRQRLRNVLAERGIAVRVSTAVSGASAEGVHTADGGFHPADEVVWATHAGGAAWLRETGLALDSKDCIRVRETLQSESDPRIFASGDVATMTGHSLEKSGVVAVRQGPVLARNLRRASEGDDLLPYVPQRRWLALIGTADGRAVASRGRFCAAGRWVWWWKNWLDRRFMERFSRLPATADMTQTAGMKHNRGA